MTLPRACALRRTLRSRTRALRRTLLPHMLRSILLLPEGPLPPAAPRGAQAIAVLHSKTVCQVEHGCNSEPRSRLQETQLPCHLLQLISRAKAQLISRLQSKAST
jgi:hypothetical protein